MLRELNLADEYNTDQDNLVEKFYKPCLSCAERYDRSVGYFRSSVFLLIGPDLVRFAQQGGRIRLICSPCLTDVDIAAISDGYERRNEVLGEAMVRDVVSILNEPQIHKNTEALATLIACGSIEVKIVFRPDAAGEFHSKVGLFYQGDDLVCFKGSVNESWTGWHNRGNHETMDVFCSWNEAREVTRTERNKRYFELLWQNKISGLVVEEFPSIARDKLDSVAKMSIGEIDPDDLEDYFVVGYDNAESVEPTSSDIIPYPHQSEALAAWQNQGRKGILEHATGSGKTITAILAVIDHLCEDGVALVLVPDKLLHKQWYKEINLFIADATIVRVGAGHTKWKKDRSVQVLSSALTGLGKRIILATIQTARTDTFLSMINAGPHLMVVADEVHEIGSTKNSNCLSIESGCRLGLSATPRRYGDAEGTAKIFDYFGGIVQPPYSLQDAIRDGRLVEYEYFPMPVNLDAEESEQWATETKEISKQFARSRKDEGGEVILSSHLQLLIIQRSRIAKKARQKIALAVELLNKHYQKGQSWLVYCEDSEQLSQLMEALNAASIECLEYHTNMETDQDTSLSYFKRFGGILCAIACLDQGVDIPKISHAMILASSQNPRQFIQRRGRVLRTCEGKHKAVIFDAMVVPISLELEPEQLSLLKSEFQRSIEFAKTAINKGAANELLMIANDLGIDLDEFDFLRSHGIEEDY